MDQSQSNVSVKTLISIFSAGLIAFLGILMTTAMNVNFPELMKDFNVPLSTIQWITTGYMIASACTMMCSSFLSKRFTFKSIFVAGAVTLIISFFICGLAVNYPMLLLGRIIGGISVGIATPLMFNIITQKIPGSKIGFYMSFGGAVISVAPTVGPTYGGFMSYYFSWQAAYWLILPISIIILISGLLTIKNQPQIEKNLKLDWNGFILAAIMLVTLTIGVSSLGHFSITTIILLVIGIASLFGFGKIEYQNPKALINTEIFKYPAFTFSFLAYFGLQLTNISLGGFLIPNFSQIALGASVLIAGLIVLPGSILRMICMPISGAALDHYGAKKPIYSGLIVVSLFFLTMTLITNNLTFIVISIAYAIYSAGFASSFSDILTNGLKGLPKQFTSDGNAAFNAIQIYGGAVGISIMSLIITIKQNMNPQLPYKSIVRSGVQYDFGCLFLIVILVAISISISFKHSKK
ncbi:MFS transporter [Philodulcilactobacillus myokoensis]|uniref:MFS transporter n=1 Tax=Philodulcilactobacillus myokoensis TaxID=2929573 RepID=A0A9W6B005_9LACO|nr:MFS transporter [Philodulcilactobacillus myokoensis]GLB46435.1 MFS transporter [Philodulcilactobacillus myokoensis]